MPTPQTPQTETSAAPYVVTVAGTGVASFWTTALEIGDVIIQENATATTEADWVVVSKDFDLSLYQLKPTEGAFVDGDKTKLDAIEAAADVTDEVNVTAALDGATLTAATVAGTDKVLIQDTDGSDELKTATAQSIADLAAGGLADIVDDASPQLGGSLDVNGQKIVSVTNGDIDIEPNGTGNVLLGNFTFDADQTVGAGQDNYVLTYDNAGGVISLEAAGGGTGDFLADGSVAMTGELDLGANSIGATEQTYTGDGATTIDFTAGNFIDFTFGAQNETLTATLPTKPGDFVMKVTQDATGSRVFIYSSPFKVAGGTAPTLSTGANKTDVLRMYSDGTNIFVTGVWLDFQDEQ